MRRVDAFFQSKAYWVIIALVGVGLMVFYRWFNPKGGEAAHYAPKCMIYKTTGLHCPGCGGQRAMHALWQGHLAESLSQNILLLPLLLFFGMAVASELRARFFNTPKAIYWLYKPRLAWASLAILVGFMVLRNLPWAPFNWLTPY